MLVGIRFRAIKLYGNKFNAAFWHEVTTKIVDIMKMSSMLPLSGDRNHEILDYEDDFGVAFRFGLAAKSADIIKMSAVLAFDVG